jgi:YHS domain-containing protein
MEKQAQWALVAAAWVMAIGVLGLGAYAIIHFGNAGPASGAALSLKNTGTAQNPIDPVDGQAVTLSPDTPHASYNGNDYYFDDQKDLYGRDHKTIFLMDPLHYLTGSTALNEPSNLTPTAVPLGSLLASPVATPVPLLTLSPVLSPVPSPSPSL